MCLSLTYNQDIYAFTFKDKSCDVHIIDSIPLENYLLSGREALDNLDKRTFSFLSFRT